MTGWDIGLSWLHADVERYLRHPTAVWYELRSGASQLAPQNQVAACRVEPVVNGDRARFSGCANVAAYRLGTRSENRPLP